MSRRRGTPAGPPPSRGVADPFAILLLDPGSDLTDDDVRAAWRRIAAATHPDRADGGDPERFAAAAASYTDLRTPFGRGEARAELPARARPPVRPPPPSPDGKLRRGWAARGRPGWIGAAAASLAARITSGRPGRLALRILAAAAASVAAVVAAGPRPAGPALVTGTVTWLVLTARHDLGAG